MFHLNDGTCKQRSIQKCSFYFIALFFSHCGSFLALKNLLKYANCTLSEYINVSFRVYFLCTILKMNTISISLEIAEPHVSMRPTDRSRLAVDCGSVSCSHDWSQLPPRGMQERPVWQMLHSPPPTLPVSLTGLCSECCGSKTVCCWGDSCGTSEHPAPT